MRMRIGRKIVLVVMLLASLALWGSSPQDGTWKLNAAKSKGTADHPVPKSLTVTIQEQAGGMTLDVVGEDAKGNPIKVHWTAKFDGKDYPSTGSAEGSNTVSVRQPDPNTIEVTNKTNGQETATVHSVVSKDGKTRTSTWSGKDTKGNSETWISVYDKQ